MTNTPESFEYLTGDRVLYKGRFGPPGTVVATAPANGGSSWLWVKWDEYPEWHEPTTHGSWACTLKERPDPYPYGIVEDGFGSEWVRCKADCGLQVVRPGKVQCDCDEPS